MNKRIVTKRGSLNKRDWYVSLYQAIALPVLVLIQQKIDSGDLFSVDWKELAMVAVGGIVIHLIRKLTEDSKVIEIKKF